MTDSDDYVRLSTTGIAKLTRWAADKSDSLKSLVGRIEKRGRKRTNVVTVAFGTAVDKWPADNGVLYLQDSDLEPVTDPAEIAAAKLVQGI